MCDLTLYIRESNEKIRPHLHSKSCREAIVVLDTDNLQYNRKIYNVNGRFTKWDPLSFTINCDC